MMWWVEWYGVEWANFGILFEVLLDHFSEYFCINEIAWMNRKLCNKNENISRNPLRWWPKKETITNSFGMSCSFQQRAIFHVSRKRCIPFQSWNNNHLQLELLNIHPPILVSQRKALIVLIGRTAESAQRLIPFVCRWKLFQFTFRISFAESNNKSSTTPVFFLLPNLIELESLDHHVDLTFQKAFSQFRFRFCFFFLLLFLLRNTESLQTGRKQWNVSIFPSFN